MSDLIHQLVATCDRLGLPYDWGVEDNVDGDILSPFWDFVSFISPLPSEPCELCGQPVTRPRANLCDACGADLVRYLAPPDLLTYDAQTKRLSVTFENNGDGVLVPVVC